MELAHCLITTGKARRRWPEAVELPPTARECSSVTRFYFDVREGDVVIVDDEGLDLSSQNRAWVEAARSVAELARDQIPKHPQGHRIVIQVRNPEELVLAVTVTFNTELLGSQVSKEASDGATPSAEEIRRLMDAFTNADPATKAKILGLVEKYASELSREVQKIDTKH